MSLHESAVAQRLAGAMRSVEPCDRARLDTDTAWAAAVAAGQTDAG